MERSSKYGGHRSRRYDDRIQSKRYRDRSRSPVRSGPSDAAKIAARKAKLAMWKAKNAADEVTKTHDDVDPLDAFMTKEVLPEVKEKEEQERRAAEQEKKKMDEMLAVRCIWLVHSLCCRYNIYNIPWRACAEGSHSKVFEGTHTG